MKNQNINSPTNELNPSVEHLKKTDKSNIVFNKIKHFIFAKRSLHFSVIVMGGIFAGEIIAMLIIDLLPPLSQIADAFLDSVLLLIISFPIYYFFVFRKLKDKITDIEQAKLALQASETVYRTLAEKIPDGVYKSTHEGKFVDVNPAMVRILGYESKEELMAIDIKSQLYFEPGDRESIILEEQLEEMGIFRLKKKDGSGIWVEDHGWYNLSENGEILTHEGILRDVTDRRQEELERQILYEITHSVTTTNNLNELLKLIHHSLEKLLYAKNYYITLHDQNTGLFSFPYYVDQFDTAPEPGEMPKSCTAYVFRTGEPLIMTPGLFIQLQKQNKVELIGEPSPSWIGVPLKTPSRIIGVLVLQHYEKENVYSEHDIQFLDSVGNQIAMAIDRRQSDADLRNERLLLRTLIDNIPDSIYCKDTACRKTLANLAELRLSGTNSETEIIGKTDFDLYPKEIAEGFFADDRLVLQTGQPVLNREEFIIDNNGLKRWLLTSKLPMKDEYGNITGLVGIGRDITIRRKAEQELRDSEVKLNVILQSTADGILAIDGSGKIIKSNKRFARLWNIPQNIIDSGDDNALLNFILEQLTDADEFISKVKKLYRSTEKDLDYLHFKDGRVFERFSAPLIMPDSAIGRVWSFRDITERKRAEEALSQEQYLMQTLMDNLPDHIYFKDLESRFIRISKSHALLFGLDDPKHATGKSDFDFFTGEHSQQAYDDEQTIIRTGELMNIEEKETYHDRPDTWVSTVKMPLYNKEGKIFGTFGISRDISKQKLVLEEIKLKNEELSSLNAEKDKFFSIIAHDLKGPFSGFLGLTQIMAEELPNLTMAEIQKIAVKMSNSATNLYRLLENLLDWSQIQKGTFPFNPEAIQLGLLAGESFEMIKESAKNKGIELTVDFPESLTVFADTNMLQAVIRNLVSNAVKFTHEGGKISLSAKAAANNNVEISIRDTGIGMNPKMVDNLFRPDVPTNRKGTDGELSTGLGLLLCKEFVEKNSGKIWIESEEGIGSTFYFTLPNNAEPQEKSTVKNGISAIEADNMVNPEVSGLKILIAEDDETSGQLISILVRKFGNEIISVQNGREAVEACRNNSDIGLILMDIQMPEMNGYEATRQIRQFNTDVIIIELTAFALTGDREKAIEAGCNDYIAKPVKKEDLFEKIQQYFNNRT